MALTRAQLLAGNSSQGIVLPGQVQGVTAGVGITIDASGILSLNGSDPAFNGFIKTNNGSAFNAYVWPGVDGTADQFLQTDGAGNLTWADAAGFAVVTVDPNPPTPPDEGELWYDCNTGSLNVYQNCVAPGGWTNVAQPGLPVLPANTSAFPVFTGGNGTQATPYDCTVTTAAVGSSVFIINTVTITGLAPYQYVPIVDLNAVINGGRFSFSNYYANAAGTLIFQTIFKDQPASPPLTAYTAAIKVGYGTVYIDAVVNIVTPVSLTSPGTISGTPEVGATLTYTPGTAVNGVAPYSYAWEWRKLSDGTSVLSGSGTAPQTYVIPVSLIGDNLYVELTVTDNIGDTDSGVTSLVPTPPATIQKGPFPATTVNFPTTIPGTANTTWNEAGTTSISSNGCLRFSVNGSPFGQGPTNITLNDTLTTEWIVSPACGGANSGTTIQGCLFSANYEECSSFAINRIPGTFPAFTPNTGVARNAVSTSNTVTPTGYNSTAYVTRGAASTGTVIEGSIDGGTNWAAIPASGTTFPINPGQTLTVRQTVGNSLNTPYDAIINIGDSTGTTSQTFTATTVITAPITGAVAPTTIPGTASFTWADAPATLTAGGCIEFSIDAGANWVTSASVTNAPATTVQTRWVNTPTSGTCGDTAGNTTISGTLTSSTGETNTFNLAMNRTPSAFSLVPNTDSTTPNTVTTANPTFTIAGTNSPSYIWGSFTTTGGTPQYSVDGGTNWAAIPTAPGTATVNPGATVKIRFTTGAAAGSEVYTVNVGASTTPAEFQSGAFTVTVATAPFPSFATTPAGGPNASPDTTALAGPSLYGTAVGAAWTDGTTNISATGSLQYKIGAGSWGQGSQTVNNTDIVSLRWDPTAAVATNLTPLSGTLTDGTYTNSYNLVVDNQPAAYTWTDVPKGAGGSAISTLNTSNVVNITGINAPAQLIYTPDLTNPLTSVEAAINGGGWTTIPTTGTGLTINPANTAGTTATTLQIRGITGSALNTDYKITTKIGDGTTWVTDEWSVGTIAATPAVQAPNIVTPSAGSTGQGTASGITITAGAYTPSGGAGLTQASSTWEVYKNSYPLTSTNTISGVTQNAAPAWTSGSTTGSVGSFQDIAYANGVYMVTGDSAGPASIYSTDGITWTNSTTTGLGGIGMKLAYLNGVWIQFVNNIRVWKSINNGVTWTNVAATPGGVSTNVLAAGNGYFVAATNLTFYVSTDGVSWTSVSVPTSGNVQTIAFTGGTFIVSNSGGGYTVCTGDPSVSANWTSNTFPAPLSTSSNSVFGAGGKFYVSKDNAGTTLVANAATPTSWTSVTIGNGGGSENLTDVAWSSQMGYIATKMSDASGDIFRSTDGTTWTVSHSTASNLVTCAAGPNNALATNQSAGSYLYNQNPNGTTTLAIANCQTEGFLVGDTVISGSGAAAGPATITSLDNTQVTVAPASTSWVGTNTQTLKRDPASYTAVTGSPFTVSTGTLTSLTIAKPPLEANTKYWVRAQYTSTAITTTSPFGGWSDFTTGTLVPSPGDVYGGGYFAGQIVGSGSTSGAGGLDNLGTIYNIVVAPASAGALIGQWGDGTTAAAIQYRTSSGTNPNTVNAQNLNFGGLCTDDLKSNAVYPVFSTFINGAAGPNAGTFNLATGGAGGGTGIGGYNDWYLPASYELEVLYYFLKPTTANNTTGVGSNPQAVSPEPVSTTYTTTNPAQTTASAFQGTSAQAFYLNPAYWSSSENSSTPTGVWNQEFGTGNQFPFYGKTNVCNARAIRRVAA